MTVASVSAPAASPWVAHLVRIRDIIAETPGVTTYELAFDEREMASHYSFQPGQFNMLYLPGYGESAISISSDPARQDSLLHTVRVAGNVTRVLSQRKRGDQLGLRGPFGSSWPMDQCKGQDVVIASGGIGLAPLRPAIYDIIRNRDDYGRVFLLYGARTSQDLLYTHEYETWRAAGIEIEVTVDIGDAEWRGQIGVVPILFYRLRLHPEKTSILTCGPEIMLRFVVFEALARKIRPDQIYVSMERNMNCGLGICGHCQLGSMFVCKDGPVFTYQQLEPYLHLEDL